MNTGLRLFIEKFIKLNPSDSVVHNLFNGAILTTLDGQFVYANGMLSSNGMHNLIPSRVTDIKWPEPEREAQAQPEPEAKAQPEREAQPVKG